MSTSAGRGEWGEVGGGSDGKFRQTRSDNIGLCLLIRNESHRARHARRTRGKARRKVCVCDNERKEIQVCFFSVKNHEYHL